MRRTLSSSNRRRRLNLSEEAVVDTASAGVVGSSRLVEGEGRRTGDGFSVSTAKSKRDLEHNGGLDGTSTDLLGVLRRALLAIALLRVAALLRRALVVVVLGRHGVMTCNGLESIRLPSVS